MWMECISDRAYRDREHLAADIVRVLREEIHFLLAAGAALVQLDEPVLTEVVFTGAKNTRRFMCGALSEKGDTADELAFARELINRVVAELPASRLAMHVCRGNWTRDERAALAGDYRLLMPLLTGVNVGTLFVELATPRAGEIDVLRDLPRDVRVGVRRREPEARDGGVGGRDRTGASSGRCRSSGRTACSSHRTAALPPSPTTRSSRRRSPRRSYARFVGRWRARSDPSPCRHPRTRSSLSQLAVKVSGPGVPGIAAIRSRTAS